MKRVAIYARCSTYKQFPESLNRQVWACMEYLMESSISWKIAGTYWDTKSGCEFGNREGFKEMLGDAVEGKFDAIIVESSDRFSRAGIRPTEAIEEFLRLSGVGVISIATERELADPESDLNLLRSRIMRYALKSGVGVLPRQQGDIRWPHFFTGDGTIPGSLPAKTGGEKCLAKWADEQ